MRTGSTSLYHYLAQHPDVFMSAEKETDFFSLGDLADRELPRGASPHRKRTRGEYLKAFSGWQGERAMGEVSPSYFFFARAAPRLLEAMPRAKLLCCLRDPCDRVHSHYGLTRKFNREHATDLRRALELEPDRREFGITYAYLAASFYDRQLQPWWSRFAKEQLHVYSFDDFVRDPKGQMRQIYEFLDVDGTFVPDTEVAFERSGVLRGAAKPFLRPSAYRRWAARHLPPKLVSRIGGVLMKPLPPMDIELRAELIETFRSDILRLQERIDRDLTAWLKIERSVTPAPVVRL
ncbi:MAG: sulfotransferase [Nannocystaceae bacterium]